MSLLQGPREVLFLMSEVPLDGVRPVRAGGCVRSFLLGRGSNALLAELADCSRGIYDSQP